MPHAPAPTRTELPAPSSVWRDVRFVPYAPHRCVLEPWRNLAGELYIDDNGCPDWRWWRAGGSGVLNARDPLEVIDEAANGANSTETPCRSVLGQTQAKANERHHAWDAPRLVDHAANLGVAQV